MRKRDVEKGGEDESHHTPDQQVDVDVQHRRKSLSERFYVINDTFVTLLSQVERLAISFMRE